MDPSLAKRLLQMIRAAYYMLRKGFSKHKLMMDLHLLLKRGKLARKAIGNLVTFHHHHDHHIGADLSSRSTDPDLSLYDTKEVEFSCSNTPSYPSFLLFAKRKNRHRHHCYDLDFAAMARELEKLSAEISDAESSAVASPSPAPMWSFGKSPAAVRQLRITDSPFPIREEDGEADGRVDREAEEFIKRFYEQLRLQQSVPPTPESQCRLRKPA
ncbi:hypothetical protein OPV22_013409 [Ensete ventricosum]|uniref:Avr9/Cf-9 rapidly elicited protein 146 n=1 Tax=Ensete ventricosum TaxID=4639 RepID=A0AAV8R0Y9_ENSVE|nr:hypothetical protein OPV22_013409 [Ensete ventricosum]RWW25476.1 hypothetical protein GW17_00010176 [Ensete ventricosum]RWW49708.1 hypothetical protein BHE74_00044086 [Ensete ventricosum]RZS27587.1 hypothetical protein BHM03_00061089 [Ensete ventricosum]